MRETIRRTTVRIVPFLLASVMAAPGALAQETGMSHMTPPPPRISATASGESRITPDRALINIAVETHAATASAAASQNATKQTKVIDAIKAAGVAAAQIRTAAYNVFPEYAQGGGQAPRVTGYRATNMVRVEVRSIESVGKVIDAALGAGANNIGGVDLFASNTDAARSDALKQAVSKARMEAETVAAAAGGSLGTLLELTVMPSGGGGPRPMMRVAMADMAQAGTPVEAGEIVVDAMVQAAWQFVPGQR